MSLQTEFLPLELANVKQCAADMKDRGYRYVQMLAVNTDDGLDLQYAYMQGADLKIYTIKGVKKGTKVPSVTDIFLEAFVFENEAHDLFGAEIEGIAIDFGGKFYHVAQSEPMTVISPAQKAAREKAEKLAAAKAAKEKGASGAADMEAKLAGMDPEKAAKVRAAIEAKAKKQAEQAEAAKADKIANLDPEKAAKLKAAMEAKAARDAAKKEQADSAATSAATDQKEGE